MGDYRHRYKRMVQPEGFLDGSAAVAVSSVGKQGVGKVVQAPVDGGIRCHTRLKEGYGQDAISDGITVFAIV